MTSQPKSVLEPYRLFKNGFDTLDIANLLQRSEPEILKAINLVRSAERDLPCPYRGLKGRAA